MSRKEARSEIDFPMIMGSAYRNLLEAFKYILQFRIDIGQLKYQMVFIGFECLPMILILSSVGSMILSINTAFELNHHGGREVIGFLIATANLREILPVFISFAIGARCGTAITAEISTMKVTEQIDALKVLKTNPIYFLLSPKIVAGIILCPFLLAMAAIVSTFAAMIVANLSVGLEFEQFLDSAWKAMIKEDLWYPLIKAEIFIIYAILINVTMGLNCYGGAREVGLATTRATAWVMIGIIILDSIITPMMYG